MGILCGYSRSFALRRTRAHLRVWGGRFYFTRIIIPLEDRAPIRAEAKLASCAYLWMDSLLTFGKVPSFGSLSPLVVLSLAFRVLTHRCDGDVEKSAVKRAITHREKHTGFYREFKKIYKIFV